MPQTTSRNPPALTPVELRAGVFVKRDDLYVVNGACGGKARAALAIASHADGLTTAGGRSSAQLGIVARIAASLGIPCRCHTADADGPLTPELADAAAQPGAALVPQRPGYTSVLASRARDDAAARPGWRYVPYGLACWATTQATRIQVRNLPFQRISHIVVPLGGGAQAAGILWGLQEACKAIPVVGVQVGASPVKNLDQLAPANWRAMLKVVQTQSKYDAPAKQCRWEGIDLDPYYEAKCVPQLRAGCLFWVVGRRPLEVG